MDDEYPQMNFQIEKKTFKDTFGKTERRSKSIMNGSSDLFKTTMKSKVIDSKEPFLNIEVNIDDRNRVEKLEIFSNDDPNTVAELFCQKYGMIINYIRFN
jgi:hypothetical protein